MYNQEELINDVLGQLGNTIGQLSIDLALARTESVRLAQELELLKNENENEKLTQELKELNAESKKEIIDHE